MKRQYKQSVKLNGGIAIPLGNNYFYMKGRKHSTGGIDVDKNLEVEDGEIVHAGKKSTKVYSSLPFLNGISPVEKLLGGQNPNKVFAEQERFKDIHGINDDGTIKKKKAFVGTETKTKTDIPAGAKIGLELFTDAAQKEIQAKQDFNKHAKFLYNTRDDMGVNERIAEAFKFANENANIRSHGYIGGKTVEARKKFWDSDKDIRQFTDSVAKSHGVDPHLLRASLSNEGIVDANIRERNMGHRHISSNDKNYVLGVTGKDFLNGTKLSDAYGLYGIDDSGTYYDKYKSMQNLIKKSGIDGENRKLRYNEKDRIVHTIQGKNNAENIITHSATLKTIQDIIANQKRYKNIPKDSLNDLTLYHFNFGPNADTPVNVAKMRKGRYNAKNYKAMGGETKRRGLYSVTSNGQTKLYSYPSTGSETQNNRVVAEKGTLFPHLAKALRGGYLWKDVKEGVVGLAERTGKYLIGEEPKDNDVVTVKEYKNGKKVTRKVKYSDYVKEQNNKGLVTKNDPEYNPITNEYETDNTVKQAGVNPVRVAKTVRNVAKVARNVQNAVKNSNKVAASTRQAVAKHNSKPPVVKKEPKVNSGNLLPLSGVKRTANPYGVGTKPNTSNYPNQQTGRVAPNVGTNLIPHNAGAVTKTKDGVDMGLIAANLAVRKGTNFVKGHIPETLAVSVGAIGVPFLGNAIYDLHSNDVIGNNSDTKVSPNQTQAAKVSPNQTQINTNKSTPKDTTYVAPKALGEAIITGNKVKPKNNIVVNNKPSNTVTAKVNPNQTQIIVANTKKNGVKKKQSIADNEVYKTRNIFLPDETALRDESNKLNNVQSTPNTNLNLNYGKIQPLSFTPNTKKDETKKTRRIKNWWNDKVKPWFKDSNNVADTIGLTSNFAGNLASAIINKKALDNMKYTDAPIPKVSAKLKTNYNINPALNSLREDLAAYNRNVDYNTESSQVALNRKRQALANAMNTSNNLYAHKENEETKLINADKLNQQGVANENIDVYNSWMKEKTNFDNAIREKRAENAVGFLNNFNLGIQDILTRRENRRKDLADAGLILAANPHVNTELLERFGINIFGNKFKPKNTTNSIANTNNKFNPIYMPKLSEFKPDYKKVLIPGIYD